MQYRIYCLDDEGRFSNTREIEAPSDDEAIAFARELNHGFDCEVWERQRLIGRVEAAKL